MSESIQILKDIEKAVMLCDKKYTNTDIWEVLKQKSTEENKQLDIEKQICILNLKSVKSQDEADLLVHHLTQHHGLIRETCAQKINEFFKDPTYQGFFQTKNISDSLLKAVNDINPNICRLIIEILPLIEDKKYFLSNLYERIEFVFTEIEKLKRSTCYTKKVFNLYWCLEALAVLKAPIDERLISVLNRSSRCKEYTIREKTAMVLHLLEESTKETNDIKTFLKNDENFYVKQYSQQW